MRKKLTIVLLVLMASLSLGGATLAQELPSVFCGDLSEADCALLTDAQRAMLEVQSGTVHLELDLSLENIPDMPFPLSFNLVADGAFSGNPYGGRLAELAGSPEALMENLDRFPQLMEEALRAFSADVTLTLTLPEMLMAVAAMNMPREGGRASELPNEFSVQVRLVDGIGYINLASIAEQFPNAGIPADWLGLDIAGFYRALLEQQMDMMGGTMPGLSAEMMSAFTDPEFLARFAAIRRVEDTTVGGQAAAVFQIDFDFGAFFSDTGIQEMMLAQMQAAAGQTGEQIDPAEMRQVFGMMTTMLQDITFYGTQTVGLDDKYIHATEFHMEWDMSALMDIAGASRTPRRPTATAPVFRMDILAAVADFNVEQDIVAPEDAIIMPLEDLMPLFALPSRS